MGLRNGLQLTVMLLSGMKRSQLGGIKDLTGDISTNHGSARILTYDNRTISIRRRQYEGVTGGRPETDKDQLQIPS